MNNQAGAKVQEHYASDDIAARILAALRAAQGNDAVPVTPEAHERLLDLGGGIGGPARWIAARFGCHVTSLDLTPEFCRAAEELNAATGLSDRVRVVEGSATDLPFPEAAFDRAYSQNVAMNIEHKRRFYAEVFCVLRPAGVFAFSQYGAGPRGEPHYPLPWAAGPATSFLSSTEETRADVTAAGFQLVKFLDRTEEILPDLRENRRRLQKQGLPPLGLQTLMGERIRDLQINVVRSAEEGRLTIIEGLVRKPASGLLAPQVFSAG